MTSKPSLALLLVLVAAAGACSSRDRAEPAGSGDSAEKSALQPVSLPDLAQMSASVQQQIRERDSVLSRRIQDTGTSAADRAAAYGELGMILLAADYPKPAESYLLNAQALATDDVRWPYYLGHLYRDRGELAKARAAFERALQLQPNDVAALVWLGDVLLGEGQPQAAEPHFKKALDLQPDSLAARFGLGRMALANEQYARALALLQEILARDPEAAAVHYPLAMAYRGLGDSKKAEAHLRLRQDHDIRPADPLMVELEGLLESPQAYETRGIQALDQEDWAAAAAYFRKGLELAPENPSLRHRLGTALFMMQDFRGARQHFEEVVRLSPDYPQAHFSLGVMLQADGRHAEAVERFSAALRSRPSYAEARVRLANSLRRLWRPGDALRHYEQVLRLNPAGIEERFGHAMALVQLGRFRDARDSLREGMAGHPDEPTFAHGLARVLAAAPDDKVRDGGQAMVLVEALLEKGRTLELGETLAMTLAELGQFDRAAAIQRDLITGANKAGLKSVALRLGDNLRLYEQGRPCRTPWAAGEIP